MSFKEFLKEASQTKIKSYKEWEKAVLSVKNVKITDEEHGGSEMKIASVPGSSEMVGKWLGTHGVIYK